MPECAPTGVPAGYAARVLKFAFGCAGASRIISASRRRPQAPGIRGAGQFPGTTMNLAIEKVGEVLVVSPEGQINSGNAAGIEADLLSHVEKGEHRFVLDMSNLNYISSAGLRVVLVLAKRLKQSAGALALCAMQPHVREVFDISGFLAILTVVDTRQEAVAKVG